MTDKQAVVVAAGALKKAEAALREITERAQSIQTETAAASKQRETLGEKKRKALAAFAETGDPKSLDAIDAELVESERRIAGLSERAKAVQEATGSRKQLVFDAEATLVQAHCEFWKSQEDDALEQLRETASPLVYRAMACERAHRPAHVNVQSYVRQALPKVFDLTEAELATHTKSDGPVRMVPATDLVSALLTPLERRDYDRQLRKEAKAPEIAAQIAARETKAAAEAEARTKKLEAEARAEAGTLPKGVRVA